MFRKVAGVLVTLALVGSAVPARAEEWNRTYHLTGRADVHLATNDGHVTVRGSDRRDIAVHIVTEGWSLERDIQVVARQSGNYLELTARIRPHIFMFDWGRRRLRIEVELPSEADLAVRSSDGALNVENLIGNVTLTTSDGSIAARTLKGDLRLRTSDGSISGEGLDGSLEAGSSDGSIHVSGRFDHLALGSSDGRIVAEAATGSTIGGGWSVHTSDGSVTLRLPDGFKANLDASAGDGNIAVDFPVTVSGKWGHHHLQGTMNGGGGVLMMRTGDGAIRVGKI